MSLTSYPKREHHSSITRNFSKCHHDICSSVLTHEHAGKLYERLTSVCILCVYVREYKSVRLEQVKTIGFNSQIKTLRFSFSEAKLKYELVRMKSGHFRWWLSPVILYTRYNRIPGTVQYQVPKSFWYCMANDRIHIRKESNVSEAKRNVHLTLHEVE